MCHVAVNAKGPVIQLDDCLQNGGLLFFFSATTNEQFGVCTTHEFQELPVLRAMCGLEGVVGHYFSSHFTYVFSP